MTELLTREAILEADDLDYEDVPVPEWGGTVRVKGLTGVERDRYESTLVEFRKDGSREMRLANARARLVALAVVDAGGKPVFGREDVKALGNKSAAALERVFAVAKRLAGLTDEDVEELTEDLDDDQSDGSTFD